MRKFVLLISLLPVCAIAWGYALSALAELMGVL